MRDIFLAELGTTGSLVRVKKISGTPTNTTSSCVAYAKGISVDGLGNVFLTGDFKGNLVFGATTLYSPGNLGSDAYIAKFDLNGNAIWANGSTAGTNNNLTARGTSVKANNAGDVFFTGYYYPTSNGTINAQSFCGVTLPTLGNQIAYVLKINANGSTAWGQFSSGAGSSSIPAGISIDPSDNVYIAGNNQGTQVMGSSTITSNGGYDVLIAKIGNAALTSTLTTALKEQTNAADVLIYPNPFKDFLTLSVTGLDVKGSMSFKVYNLLGELVKSYPDISSSFTFNRGDMPQGIYSYVLSQNNQILKSGKIIAQ